MQFFRKWILCEHHHKNEPKVKFRTCCKMAPSENNKLKMIQNENNNNNEQQQQNDRGSTLLPVQSKRKPDLLYKVLIVGESRIGKTSIIKRLKNNEFKESTISTVGLDFVNVDFEIEGLMVRLQIWDTAGQERYRTITKNHFRHTKGILLAYDVTDYETFEHLKYWIETLSNFDLDNEVVYLIGNKIDLVDQRKVRNQDGLKLANHNSIKFFETSAKTGENLIDIFYKLAVDILENKDIDKISKYRTANGVDKFFTHNYTMEPVIFIKGEEEVIERRKLKNIFRKKQKKQAPKVPTIVNNNENGDRKSSTEKQQTKRRSIIKLLPDKKKKNVETEQGCCIIS